MGKGIKGDAGRTTHIAAVRDSMALRRGFLRALQQGDGNVTADAGPSTPSASATVDGPDASRRSYFASLREQTVVAEEKPQHATVNFSFATLREFQANTRGSRPFKKPVPVPEKRPNYNNNNKRKFYANPTDRIRLLGWNKAVSFHFVNCIFSA